MVPQPGWEGSLGENGYMYKYDCLRCSPESITAFLISYIPIQNKKLLKKKKSCLAVETQTQRTDLWTWWGVGEEGEGGLYGESSMETYITIYKTDSQWEFAV